MNFGDYKRCCGAAIFTACLVVPMHQLGLFQAAACGARLLVNDGPGIAEVFARPLERPAVSLDNQDSVTEGVLSGLAEPAPVIFRKPICGRYALKACLKQWLALLECCLR